MGGRGLNYAKKIQFTQFTQFKPKVSFIPSFRGGGGVGKGRIRVVYIPNPFT